MASIPPNPRRVRYIDPIHGPLDGPLYMGSHIHQQIASTKQWLVDRITFIWICHSSLTTFLGKAYIDEFEDQNHSHELWIQDCWLEWEVLFWTEVRLKYSWFWCFSSYATSWGLTTSSILYPGFLWSKEMVVALKPCKLQSTITTLSAGADPVWGQGGLKPPYPHELHGN